MNVRPRTKCVFCRKIVEHVDGNVWRNWHKDCLDDAIGVEYGVGAYMALLKYSSMGGKR